MAIMEGTAMVTQNTKSMAMQSIKSMVTQTTKSNMRSTESMSRLRTHTTISTLDPSMDTLRHMRA